jgi:hypothetical protein
MQASDRTFAVKVTGDPNIPAGQVSFVIPSQPLLLRPTALPCGCRSELGRGIFGAQDDDVDCNCPSAEERSKFSSGINRILCIFLCR